MTEPFDADAARRARVVSGMSEHHIDWSVALNDALRAEEADPSPENRHAYDELARKVQAARQYEREELAGVPEAERLGEQAPDGGWRWHHSVAEAEQDPGVATSRPELLPESYEPDAPADVTAQAPTIRGGSSVSGG